MTVIVIGSLFCSFVLNYFLSRPSFQSGRTLFYYNAPAVYWACAGFKKPRVQCMLLYVYSLRAMSGFVCWGGAYDSHHLIVS